MFGFGYGCCDPLAVPSRGQIDIKFATSNSCWLPNTINHQYFDYHTFFRFKVGTLQCPRVNQTMLQTQKVFFTPAIAIAEKALQCARQFSSIKLLNGLRAIQKVENRNQTCWGDSLCKISPLHIPHGAIFCHRPKPSSIVSTCTPISDGGQSRKRQTFKHRPSTHPNHSKSRHYDRK